MIYQRRPLATLEEIGTPRSSFVYRAEPWEPFDPICRGLLEAGGAEVLVTTSVQTGEGRLHDCTTFSVHMVGF